MGGFRQKSISLRVFTTMALIGAVLPLYQNCDNVSAIPEKGEVQEKRQPLMNNGQGYGGKPGLETMQMQSYYPTSEGRLKTGKYYSFGVQNLCSGTTIRKSVLEVDESSVYYRENQCNDSLERTDNWTVTLFNNESVEAFQNIFQYFETEPDENRIQFIDSLLCRTTDAFDTGVQVSIKEKIREEDYGSSQLSIDFSQGWLPSLVTFSRQDESDGIATFFDSDGLLRYSKINEPRFDHHPNTREPLGLLIERSATNLILYSENFTRAPWSHNPSQVSITENTHLAPDGQKTADSVLLRVPGAAISQQIRGGLAEGEYYTFSVWARVEDVNRSSVEIVLRNGERSQISSGPISLTQKWQRIYLTSKTSIGAQGTVEIRNARQFGPLLLQTWGAQLEHGGVATSYIPTLGVSRKRGADFPRISDLSWLHQGQGTFLAEFSVPFLDNNSTARVLGLRGTANDKLVFYRSGLNSNFFWTNMVSDGVAQYQKPDGHNYRIQPATPHRAVLSYKKNQFHSSINGISNSQLSGETFSNAETLFLGVWNGNQHHLNGHLKQVVYWSEPKPRWEVKELSYPDSKYTAQVFVGEESKQSFMRRSTNVFSIEKSVSTEDSTFTATRFNFGLQVGHSNLNPYQSASVKTVIDGKSQILNLICLVPQPDGIAD